METQQDEIETANHDDCSCTRCFIRKRLEFHEDEVVELAGKRVVGYIDIAVVEDAKGERTIMFGTEGTPAKDIRDVLLAISGMTNALREETRIVEVPDNLN